MSDFSQIPQQRDFLCPHCSGKIVIPFSLPPTTGPCPLCQQTITSPPPPEFPPQAEPEQTAPLTQPTTVPPEQTATHEEALAGSAAGIENDELDEPGTTEPKKKSSVIIPAMIGLLCLILAAGLGVFFLTRDTDDKIAPPSVETGTKEVDITEANYIRIGWQKDAYKVLEDFITGTTVKEKLPYILKPDELEERIDSFYGGVSINDQDTPANSFSVAELPEEDRKRGIFMLTYDQPPQFALKDFFRPLASLEVQYGIDQADLLLSTFARVGNFAMEPVRAHAFFKRTDDGLKLDWEVYVQTKYRLLQSFVELPDPGVAEVFRVLIVEDVPEKGQGVVGARTYRVLDPANLYDYARINVQLDSEVGRALSIINWRGTQDSQPITRTATLELKWSEDQERPVLMINRFICWEFLDLGGERSPASN